MPHAIEYLADPVAHSAKPVCVVFGDEPYLKREVLRALRRQVSGGDEGEFSLTTLAGKEADWRDVVDDLATIGLFGGPSRTVVVDEAEPFVKAQRSQLEAYAERPKPGVLILEVKSWPANTRLYKALDKVGLQIECTAPKPAQLKKWLKQRTKQEYGCELKPAAAELLLELIEPELGLLDQEISRLSLLADGSITPELVREQVGHWRTLTVWELCDAAAAGNARSALSQLDRLLRAGEDPIGILARISVRLRQFATATAIFQQAEQSGRRVGIRQVLEQAGVPKFVLSDAERQLRQLGRDRAGQLHEWLLRVDLGLKGAHSQPQRSRRVLERLIVQMADSLRPVATS